MKPARGVVLGDRYRLERAIGAGGMAAVWLAHDDRLHRWVAIKLVADSLAQDPQWLARFTREARAAAAVAHPNIVNVYDYGLQDGHPYLVMAYIDGPNLSQHLKDPDRATIDRTRLVEEILDALGAVHRGGIVHRDVKAANVLLDQDGHAHLADFGIARTEDSTALTQTGMVIGTLRYLAPELMAGHPATVASDLYAAGMVVREIAGTTPPDALTELADELTRPDPADRPATAAIALHRLAHGPSDEAAPTALTVPRDTTEPTAVLGAPPTNPTAETALAPTVRQLAGAGEGRDATRMRVQPPRAIGDAATASDAPKGALRAWLTAGGGKVRFGAAVAAVVVVLVMLVVVTSGSPTPKEAAAPKPAASGASLSEQVRSLRSIVDQAADR